jgi:hypothetical protein
MLKHPKYVSTHALQYSISRRDGQKTYNTAIDNTQQASEQANNEYKKYNEQTTDSMTSEI